MIDWWNVAGHAVWIVGAAVLLARFSYRRYEAAERRRLGIAQSRSAIPDVIYRLGLVLVSVGLGVSSTSWIERAIWGLLAVASIAEVLLLRRRRARPGQPGDA
jgi:hypothetical protein